MSHDAIESDSGERDIPSPLHFINFQPVERLIIVPPGRHKALNRRGRAISRIMHAHDWRAADIAKIFGVSVTSVDHCLGEYKQYHPNDQPENDYYYAGDEFKERWPPLVESDAEVERKRREKERAREKVALSTGRRVLRRPQYTSPEKAKRNRADSDAGDSDGDENPTRHRRILRTRSSRSLKRTRNISSDESESGSTNDESMQQPRNPKGRADQQRPRHGLPIPTPPRPVTISLGVVPTISPSHPLSGFLTSALSGPGVNFATPTHLGLFTLHGFTVERFQALAQWTDQEITEALKRLLAPNEDGIGLDMYEVGMLGMKIKELRVQSIGNRTIAIHTASSLRSFLSSVYGIDLSPHHHLLTTRGYTLARLQALSHIYSTRAQAKRPVDPTELTQILRRGLERVVSSADAMQMGMSPLEVVALEFALRAG
uniref:Uncharacterized protein n=1 Tax=Mycena chlorophos TaxID=658473 RepID=A0ABQ0LMQ7_MYCCL|nr:predicted protein [Mycena chlorophos]